jgi:lipoprotein-anchoring transpeptidase ErfK/SrfK
MNMRWTTTALLVFLFSGASVADATLRAQETVAVRDTSASVDSSFADSAARSGAEAADAMESASGPLTLRASLGARELYVERGGKVVKTYQVAVGKSGHPTPKGSFGVRRIVWNPGWVPPPNAKWARGKTAKEPGQKGNPMKVVKIFFRQPDYFIHGTDDVGSLGKAASHGCLRMEPWQAAELAQMIMANGGQNRDWNWIKRTLRLGSERTVQLQKAVPLTITS